VTEEKEILDRVRSALRSEPRIRPTDGPIRLAFANGNLTMEGEVDHIAGKKLALERAARIPEVATITDRLHVRPATPMGDGEIRDRVRDALLEDSDLARNTIRVRVKGAPETVREPADATGVIEISVQDGIVTLDGDVVGLGQKRLAGVLAWWVPGSRDVINGLGVTPPENDSEAAITDAVRLVLEKDPFVNAESIRVHTYRATVVLEGTVPREAERKLAEDDAWYVFGVDAVVNRLTTRA
jgi:osmotically-inducible protein OsmY